MNSKPHQSPNLIYSVGTQVVTLKSVVRANREPLYPSGAVGVIVYSPSDRQHAYRVRFPDGFEACLHHDQLALLAEYQLGNLQGHDPGLVSNSLFDRVIFRCVIGSRAYGLDNDQSDTDRRGIYLPPADLQWSLYGVPEQLENEQTQEAYWELQKFIVLALKANPNVLECLYSPIVEQATPLAEELLSMREIFLSRIVYQTYNGYVMSQFKKMQTDLKNQGRVKPKHVMHLIRLLISGIRVLRDGFVPVDVGPHRPQLLAIRNQRMPWEEVEVWRKELHQQFEQAFAKTRLPERPDYQRANEFLIRARRAAMSEELP